MGERRVGQAVRIWASLVRARIDHFELFLPSGGQTACHRQEPEDDEGLQDEWKDREEEGGEGASNSPARLLDQLHSNGDPFPEEEKDKKNHEGDDSQGTAESKPGVFVKVVIDNLVESGCCEDIVLPDAIPIHHSKDVPVDGVARDPAEKKAAEDD